MFGQIKPTKKKKVKVAEQIFKAIKQGKLKPGDKLPSEHELAETMNVSRPSIREALSGLQVLKIVHTKVGSGTYISESLHENSLLATDLSLMEKNIDHLHIIEARRNLENAILKFVIKKADEAGINQLKKALTRMDKHSTEKEYEEYMDADHDFHEAFVELSDNPLVVKAAQPLLATIHDPLYREFTHKYYLVDDSRIKRCFNTHRDLLKAIQARDLKKAKDSTAVHWELMEDALERSGEE